MSEFFAMGGYAFYVWTSYALFVLMLIVDYLQPRWMQRRALKEAERRQRRASARNSS